MPLVNVLIVSQDEDVEDEPSYIWTCTDTKTMNEVIGKLTYGNIDDENVRAYQGILLDSNSVPEKFNGIVPKIIIQSPFIVDDIEFAEVYMEDGPRDPEKLREKIKELTEKEFEFMDNKGDVQNITPNFDDIYLFFGQQLFMIMQLDEYEEDEEFDELLLGIKESIKNKEDKNMAESFVTIDVESGKGVEKPYKIFGKLLGMCSSEEALKIVQNSKVSEQVYKGPSYALKTVISAVNKTIISNYTNKVNPKSAHIVATINTIEKEDGVKQSGITDSIYISPPVKRIASSIDSKEYYSAQLDFENGEKITIISVGE